MKPIFKYSGGKTRELKRIDKIIDGLSFERIIEPFAGGCAFAFSQEKPSIISDIRHNNIDVYKAVKDKSQFDILYTKHGNPKPGEYDRADSLVIARAGFKVCCQKKES